MGALHEGHISLVEQAKRQCAHVAVSIFVNPTQFGPKEDFSRYPRPVERDLAMCREAGVDVVFMPQADEMYPLTIPRATIDVPALTSTLEGLLRPGHFAGVCTVVAKLLNIVTPEAAFFGEKDFQQLAVIRAMVQAMDMSVKIVGCPTKREEGGLAMSSRNQYLSQEERARALSISRALRLVAQAVSNGERDCSVLRNLMRGELLDAKGLSEVPVELQYATVVDATTLRELDLVEGEARALIAMKVGTTRLIDNMALVP